MDVKDAFVRYHIFVLGAGGTGSFFLKEFSRYAASLSSEQKRHIGKMVIVDGDSVEEKNLSRQAFQSEDVGRNKAVVLAEALNEVFGTSWLPYERYISNKTDLAEIMLDIPKWSPYANGTYIASEKLIDVALIIGCVDNHACRKVVETIFNCSPKNNVYYTSNMFYYDSANEVVSGQCVFAHKFNGKMVSPCRSVYFPEIFKGELKNRSDMSCTELNSVKPQHIFTNMAAGLQLLEGVSRLFENEKPLLGFSSFIANELHNEFISWEEFQKFRK